jgi:dTMP kinase
VFVVFEGIDGSGKTTVSKLVTDKLREAGITVEHLREGGKFSSAVTQAIREFGRDARNLDLTPQAEFFLYVTRDVQLLDEKTRPALRQAEVVIADRFLYSAEILARFGRGLSEEFVRPVLTAAAGGIVPDLVVLVDVSPYVARARRQVAKGIAQDKTPPSRKGLSGVGMQHRFRAGYRELAKCDPERWAVVDNDQDLNATVDSVFQLLSEAALGVKSGAKDAVQAARARWRPPELKSPLPAQPPRSPQDARTAFLAWIDDRAQREPHVAAYFLSGLWGPGIDQRRRDLADRVPDTVLRSLAGLDDPVSWELREALFAKSHLRVVRALSGFPDVHLKARRIRADLLDRFPIDVLASLEGADDEETWKLRERLYTQVPDVVAGSTIHLGTPRAWALRERWLADKGGFGAFSAYETARVACKMVSAIDDDRAWEFRKVARETAPIAAIGSLSRVVSDRAWKWRDKWVARAPKTVFGTLRRSDDPRAWQMREAMATVCKEAVDCMQDLDGPRAWAIRERCADVWPSTVVKSLGPLADAPQGRDFVARQLRGYPDNISLLKHATAIAAGAHLRVEIVVD